jgi:cytochrome c-type biogenesis protein CcmH
MAVLTAAASLAILVPLHRASGGRSGAVAAAIYRDQLEELDRDVARGVVAEGDAGAARAEIARRLIKASAPVGADPPGSVVGRKVATFVGAAFVPIAAVAIYLLIGAPGMRDAPLSARQNAPLANQDVAMLIARVESSLSKNPDDGRGWSVIAPIYARLGRYADAQNAYQNAIRLLGPTADREAAIGEAITNGAGGVVTQEAKAAFQRALALDAKAISPRFFLAMALGQEGKTNEAIAAWQALLADAPAEDAPWVTTARGELARLQSGNATPGPTPDQVTASENMTPEQRTTMIEGMVASLAQRLESQPDDPEGWARLIRSYVVLNRSGEARDALSRARAALAAKPDELAKLASLAQSLGLTE